MIFGALAASVLVMAEPRLAAARPDPPVINGDTATCTGDQHLGIASGIDFLTPPVLNLYVNSLTTDITPDNGVAGIKMLHQGANGGNGASYPFTGDNGGNGDRGQDLTVNFTGGSQAITTQGGSAAGILVQSSGGNGGNGGDAYILGTGGNGGDGGNGGAVTLTSSGPITTSGAQANGIQAVSQGGNGGNGGSGYGVYGIGGNGGAGGNSGAVTITSSSVITTQGEKANGIFAASVGGDGGAGGAGYGLYGEGGNGGSGGSSGNVTLTSTGSIITNGDYANGIFALSQAGAGGKGGEAAGVYGQGGDGGVGGTAGVVTVTSNGNITTSGVQAQGIRAQSVGGAGGNGGFGGGIIGQGGASLGSGPGGRVEVTSTGAIATSGAESRGIFAQSVGGFAGSSGGAGGLFAFGASGQSAGSGGEVAVTNSGAISTLGAYADAIVAQSIGGGGGTGGGGVSIVSLGGSGSSGGDGGVVTVNNSGVIQVSGASSRGIFAQSVGGGGGDGGNSVGLVSIGGSGSSTSHGSSVTVTNSGAITSTSNAIFAESVGGGGGSGGISVGLVSLGGSGGGGGDGGAVAVTNSGALSTSEVNASAIFAQSVGGGGGNGGGAVAVGVLGSVAIGGSADQGGAGNTVTVTNNAGGNITTTGNSSHGILAQSLGGGGGHGGFSVSVTGGGVVTSASVAIGGAGGGGGSANTVTVHNFADITTQGEFAHGILAQSVGGGGGDGGYSVAVTAGAPAIGYQVSVAVGGAGGKGGDGGEVTVASEAGNLLTTGDHSYGILAQSVGGGGGSGGFSVAANIGMGPPTVNVAVGGKGGSGGAGSAVKVTNGSNITTQGNNSIGLLAQSIGGGGGSGGATVSGAISIGDLGVAVGGKGGDGGDGGQVSVSNAGTICTSGDGASGILAQSVGGGGGSGGLSVVGAITGNIVPTVSVGGEGGKGWSGNEVTVTNSGQIYTQGELSLGILAQSVGGGGGNGGLSVSASGGVVSVDVSVGGKGGDGGDGGQVNLSNSGAISTSGNGAMGILAQSVGGGGGNGGGSIAGSLDIAGGVSVSVGGSGGSGGNGLDVIVNSAGTISTSGDNAAGILAQSIGGGGGNGGFSVAANGSIIASVDVSVGGSGNTGGSGGTVNLASSSSIATQGSHADGILAQSVGGGGGSGGFSVSGSVAMGVIPQIPVSAGVSVTVGGTGGTGGAAGPVYVTSNGEQIATVGDASRGIFAQSLGGGGGNGGFSGAIAVAVDKTAPLAFAVSVGGSGGSGNTSGLVEVNSSSNISTQGNYSQGILAQSIGGGGGTGAISGTLLIDASIQGTQSYGFSLSIGGNGGTGGDSINDPTTGYAVKVSSTGSLITTSGSYSTGILAQSIGGGGGHGGISVNVSAGGALNLADVPILNLGCKAGGGGDAGGVLVENSSNIYTTGDYASGILAQSVGGGGGTGGTEIKGSASLSWGMTGVSAGLSLGASGESGAGGGTAAAVMVTESLAPGQTTKIISTQGLTSAGILAQSIGGGGGNGGFSLSGSVGLSTLQIFPAFDYTAGGRGGAGGAAGAVSVTSVSSIQTLGGSSQGILAQSIGGGGGNGGIDIAVSASVDLTFISGFHVAMGGDGGKGSNGANVTVSSSGEQILTAGNSSAGILAQSVGGGGGNGGGSISLGIGVEAAIVPPVSLSMGGKGGSGGSAGDVTVTSSSSIYTGAYDTDTGAFKSGNDSQGIVAQSIGGGGGNAGYSMRARADIGALLWGTSLSFGGAGGNGNTAGAVNVTSTGEVIRTLGDRSQGILAQSVGGGGGNGGFSVAGGVSNGIELTISSGGNGGSGANAGTVTVTNSSSIITGYVDPDGNVYGHDSAGILSQSLGGGGGNGAFSVSGSVGLLCAPSISLGGNGAGGGDGAGVTINHTGAAIITQGDRAAGISGLSVGGGGGNAGFSVAGGLSCSLVDLALTYGSNGGFGGNAGAVTINNGPGSLILTTGADSQAILAQSIGDGGGNAAFSVAGDLTLVGVGVGLSFGSNGGSGGSGGAVTVTDAGGAYLATQGERAAGILAQSIGGGGGYGGFIASGGFGMSGGVSLSFGGSGGANGDGGTVAVTTGSSIYTAGNDSTAILAQSIGGGGGVGGVNVGSDLTGATSVNLTLGGSGAGGGNGNNVAVVATGNNIITLGDRSSGILAQSIGGGGGVGWVGVSGAVQADSATLTIGGQNGASGAGGLVTVQNASNILVYGTGSYGIVAQSIGGGGGVGSNAALASPSGVTLGGGAGVSGAGGAVTVTNAGWINTEAAGSYGIIAQSIGGGGGLACYTGGSISGWNTSMPQGNGTNSGNGGAVSVTNSGTISTAGFGAAGIVAQSVGGGGGVNVDGNAGSAGGSGSSGAITINHSGVIYTSGDYAHGIVAQSAGGTGTGGAVDINISGQILTQGQGADGIYAQSKGAAGNGNIAVTIAQTGVVYCASQSATAVKFVDGKNNLLQNYGLIQTPGYAVTSTDGANTTINNYGSMLCSIQLGQGTNVFNNLGTFQSGAVVNLGAGNSLISTGNLAIGDQGVVATTTLTGNLVQTGLLQVDVDHLNLTADQLLVSGTAKVGGKMEINHLNLLSVMPGSHQDLIISAAGGGDYTGISLASANTAVMKNQLLIPNATDLVLSSNIDFNPADLSRNQHIIGGYINKVLLAGGGQWLSPVLGYYLGLADARGLGGAYDSLLPYTNEADTLATIQINRQYLRGFQDRMEWLRPSFWGPANTAMSLSPTKPVLLAYNGPNSQLGQFLAPGETASIQKRAGFWINGFSQFAHSSADGFTGFKYITAGTCAGFDYAFTDRLVAGVGGGYAGTNLDLSGDWGHSNFNSYFATVYGTYFTDQAYLEGVLSYGKHRYSDNHLIDLGTGRLSATSSHNGDSLSSMIEGGYTFRPKGFVVQPFTALSYIYLNEGSFQESGAGALGLNIGGRQSNSLASEVGARLARPVKIPQGTLVPKVSAAWYHDFGIDKLSVPAAFQGAPAVGFAMNSRSLGENRAVLGAEIAFVNKTGISASLRYDADLGNSFVSQAVTGQLKVSF